MLLHYMDCDINRSAAAHGGGGGGGGGGVVLFIFLLMQLNQWVRQHFLGSSFPIGQLFYQRTTHP